MWRFQIQLLPRSIKGALEETFRQECAAIWEMREMPDYVRTLDLGNRGLLYSPSVHPHLPNLTTLKLTCNSIAFLPAHLSDLAVRVVQLLTHSS